MNPKIVIDRAKLRHNAETLSAYLTENGLQYHFVTKVVCAHPEITQILAEAGIRHFADSRVENLQALKDIAESRMLLRMPMISEAGTVVESADLSLNSEIDTINALSDAAVARGLDKHGVILMVELGDLREGILPEDVMDIAHQVLNLRGVRLAGIGVNFNCYGGVIPTADKMKQLAEIAETIERRFNIKLDYISGGNSGSLHLIDKGEIPEKVNHLRIGEALFLGNETSYGHRVLDLHQDVFRLEAEVIENKRKASVPDGEIGKNFAGETPVFEDRGNIRRVILAIGRQDVDFDQIVPQRKNIDLLGSSSDHAIYDITNSNIELAIGDTVAFDVTYASLMRLFTSKYVHKELV